MSTSKTSKYFLIFILLFSFASLPASSVAKQGKKKQIVKVKKKKNKKKVQSNNETRALNNYFLRSQEPDPFKSFYTVNKRYDQLQKRDITATAYTNLGVDYLKMTYITEYHMVRSKTIRKTVVAKKVGTVKTPKGYANKFVAKLNGMFFKKPTYDLAGIYLDMYRTQKVVGGKTIPAAVSEDSKKWWTTIFYQERAPW